MRIKILNFGSNWWSRFGSDANDPHRFSRRAAYFNSTGVQCGRKVRRHWIVSGLIRFNGIGDFNPHFPLRLIGQTFSCSDLTFAYGGNRVLFKQMVRATEAPDFYLVVISSPRFGRIDFALGDWKSESVRPIAVSDLREKQEVMLLMNPQDWVSTALGYWQLQVSSGFRYGAALQLVTDDVLSEGIAG